MYRALVANNIRTRGVCELPELAAAFEQAAEAIAQETNWSETEAYQTLHLKLDLPHNIEPKDLLEYADHIEKSTKYGGKPELNAFSNEKKCKVEVFSISHCQSFLLSPRHSLSYPYGEINL
uniref:Uncharacterized protein n=1 Tax=Chromera velia CCMP2878 TaxID=1169474 RepID=A0A0G4HWZ1_9ALVE|eukprot:Cvel_9139.t1-p1 / transcript=Cvel_9139.t1 / gene=Cvel_9139 / organism=Chromera_velia_CCMP2878 / gene_product=hypothetical protein / transcript_product=hypothetical protein / location=Cvel_scaffold520:6086-6602(+) / protein_length=120 / sequence_SO=supercontig / SO=protein_coding / is_pseudo=false